MTDEPGQGTPPETKEESAEESKPSEEEIAALNADKEKLENEIAGKQGTIDKLDRDIVTKREERRGEGEEELPDKEKLKEELKSELKEELKEELKPATDENLKLQEQLKESEEENLKIKQANLEALNARIASATVSKPSVTPQEEGEPEVELPADEAKIAKELGLKDPRYMKDVEVRGMPGK